MPTLLKKFNHSFLVNSPISTVWDFYTDLHHLETITPKKLDLRITKFSNQRITLGQTASFSSKIITRIKWDTKITHCKPYKYVDEMSNVLFKSWKHTHDFYMINKNQTRINDEIEFELQFGIIGKMFDHYACNKLEKIFVHRENATVEALNKY